MFVYRVNESDQILFQMAVLIHHFSLQTTLIRSGQEYLAMLLLVYTVNFLSAFVSLHLSGNFHVFLACGQIKKNKKTREGRQMQLRLHFARLHCQFGIKGIWLSMKTYGM